MTNHKLDELRAQLDAIDDSLAALYHKRMDVVKQVAKEKQASHLPLSSPTRETQIKNRVAKDMPAEYLVGLDLLFSSLFETSRALQLGTLQPNTPLLDSIQTALNNSAPFPKRATIACQGEVGSFAHIATQKLFLFADTSHFNSFSAVFRAVELGLCEFGVLPVENNTAGSVNEVYDLMQKHKFHVVGAIKLPVHHCLAAKHGTNLADITTIYSHPQALSQCEGYLSRVHKAATRMPMENTATAAQHVANAEGHTAAAICSPLAAKQFGLSILKNPIQDASFNHTRFICIAKTLQIYEKSDKISLMLQLPHTAGSLANLLNQFAALGLNLTKLESRPNKNTDFQFSFYFDFLGDIRRPDVQALLAKLSQQSEPFTFLGSYHEEG